MHTGQLAGGRHGTCLGALGGAGDAGAPAASTLLQRTLRACPAIEEPVIDAIGEMGPRGASAAPAMQAILRDRERPPKLRALAATALHRLAVPRNAGDQAEAPASCLQQHTCGPASTDRDLTIDACCRRAFGASPPAWCRPSPEPAADY
jgi:hypothetical protein